MLWRRHNGSIDESSVEDVSLTTPSWDLTRCGGVTYAPPVLVLLRSSSASVRLITTGGFSRQNRRYGRLFRQWNVPWHRCEFDGSAGRGGGMATTVSHAHRRGRADIFSPGFIPTVTIASFRRITAPVRLTPSFFYHWVRCGKVYGIAKQGC